MEEYWALDYLDQDYYSELIYNNQLYRTREEAQAARAAMDCAKCLSVVPYSRESLERDVYGVKIHIDEDLCVHSYEW